MKRTGIGKIREFVLSWNLSDHRKIKLLYRVLYYILYARYYDTYKYFVQIECFSLLVFSSYFVINLLFHPRHMYYNVKC